MSRALKGFVAAVLAMLVIAPPVNADSGRDVVSSDVYNDAATIYEGGYKQLEVVVNDGFTETEDAQVCRLKEDTLPAQDVAYIDFYDKQISVAPASNLASEGSVFTFSYYSCNADMSRIVLATVTVTVQDVLSPRVRKTGEVGKVRFRNPNLNDSLTCLYGSFREPMPDGEVVIGADSSKVRKTWRKRLDWVCYLGPDYIYAGEGRVRRIPQGDTRVNSVSPPSRVSTELVKRWRESLAK